MDSKAKVKPNIESIKHELDVISTDSDKADVTYEQVAIQLRLWRDNLGSHFKDIKLGGVGQ